MAVNASYVNDFPAIIKANIRHLKDWRLFYLRLTANRGLPLAVSRLPYLQIWN
jgi:hypothetical protein